MIDVPYNVKRALKDGNRPKQYRFQVLNDDETVDFTIDNDTLVKESVKIDERMCSGDRLKFGLCEGASLEFQYFNHPNIRGRRVKVYLDVAYDNEGTEAYYPLSMGYFDVNQCSTQFSTGIIKAVAYNKLRSDYLDQKANDLISKIPANTVGGTTTLYDILQETLKDYTIEEVPKEGITPNVPRWPNTYGLTFENLQFTYEGGTYYPVIVFGDYCSARTDEFTKVKTLQIYELNDYIDALRSLVNSMKTAIYEKISNADQIWNGILSAGFPSGLHIYVYLDTDEHSSSQRLYNYTLEELINNNTPSNYKALISDQGINWWNVAEVRIDIPSKFQGQNAGGSVKTLWSSNELFHLSWVENKMYLVDGTEYSDAELISVDPQTLPDVTLRELQSAVYETSALYGQLDRDTDLFYGVELNSGSLTPSASLYPSATLYPNQGYGSNIFRPFPSEYQKLWTDSVGEQTFRYLIITYKAIEYDQQGNPTEVDKTLQRTVHEHGTTNYNCSDNWLFRNLVWTAEQVGAYADAMVEKMLNIRWFPFEMWSTGLPYVEVGDAIEIADKEGDTHISYVLQRQLNGIQNLQDTYINGQLDIF